MRGGGFKEKGIKGLAWTSFVLAVVGGAALAVSFVGNWITAGLDMFPAWVRGIGLFAAVVAIAIDLFVDGIPNQVAVYSAIAIPVVAKSTSGALASNVTQLSNQLLTSANAQLGAVIGTTVPLAMGVAAVAASLLVARRVIAKGGGR
jgi:hypothetical protein